MTDEEKLKSAELERDEKELFLEEFNGINRSKLDQKVLLSIFVGIIAVFCLMIIINGFIFRNTSDQKTAYYISILTSNTLFVILILIIKVGKHFSWAELGWKSVEFIPSLKDILKIWGLTWLIQIIYMLIITFYGIIPTENELVELLQKPTFFALVVNILLIAIAAPFIEETLFRGLLFGSLKTYFGCWSAIIISAAIFSALHFELIGFVPRFALGIGLGYLYVKHDSIYPSIGLHALNNLFAIILISVFS